MDIEMEQVSSTAVGMPVFNASVQDADDDIGEAISMSSAESVSVLIEEFGAIREVRNGTYNRLHGIFAGCSNAAEAERILNDGEHLYVMTNYTEQQRIENSTKAGKLKMSKLLPNDYQSAKSILLRAKADGIPMFDEDGDMLGKSALSNAVAGKAEKTAQEKLNNALNNALKYAREVYGDKAKCVMVRDDMFGILQEVNA